MNLQETHTLRRLDAAFEQNRQGSYTAQIGVFTDKGFSTVTVRRHGKGKFLASSVGISLPGETPSAAAMKVANHLAN